MPLSSVEKFIQTSIVVSSAWIKFGIGGLEGLYDGVAYVVSEKGLQPLTFNTQYQIL